MMNGIVIALGCVVAIATAESSIAPQDLLRGNGYTASWFSSQNVHSTQRRAVFFVDAGDGCLVPNDKRCHANLHLHSQMPDSQRVGIRVLVNGRHTTTINDTHAARLSHVLDLRRGLNTVAYSWLHTDKEIDDISSTVQGLHIRGLRKCPILGLKYCLFVSKLIHQSVSARDSAQCWCYDLLCSRHVNDRESNHCRLADSYEASGECWIPIDTRGRRCKLLWSRHRSYIYKLRRHTIFANRS